MRKKEDLRIMEYWDEKLLEAKRELEYQKHTTLQTGMYAGEELMTGRILSCLTRRGLRWSAQAL